MPSKRGLRSRLAIVTTIAVALAVFVALPSLAQPQAASAQGTCGSVGNVNCGSYGNGYTGAGCQQTLFSASGCTAGTSGGVQSCAALTLSLGQTCSNGVVSCAQGATTCASSGYGYTATSCPPKLTTPQCTAASNAARAPAVASAVIPSSGVTTCPQGGYVSAGQSCGGASISAATSPPAGTASASTGFQVSLGAGWNLVAGPAGTMLPGAGLLTFQAGDTSYETVSAGTPFKAGVGYWAFFPVATPITLASAAGSSTMVALPAGQPVMIGNPGNAPATVTGADQVFVYNPSTSGYTAGVQLQPGQGAWAMSTNGGQATITSAPAGQAGLAGANGS